jgi:two-component system, cell cycle response regulator DivK
MAKILYVEDNEDNVYMLSSRLKRRGHEVIVATDGNEGVALARSETPALILMDLSLPVVDGWEATRRLKALPETRDIPVIAISAHAMAGDRASAFEAGCDDFDTKPIEFDRLMRKIEQFFSKARDHDEGPT